MKYKNKIITIALIVITTFMFVIIPKPTTAQFVIAGWDFPDQHGQGIDAIYVYENSTGSWLLFGGYGPQIESTTSDTSFNWTAEVGIKIRVECNLNSTISEAVDITDGRNYIRHNVTVSIPQNSSIFTQSNFTYFSSATVGDLFIYKHEVVLNFLPQAGNIYTVLVTCEVYY